MCQWGGHSGPHCVCWLNCLEEGPCGEPRAGLEFHSTQLQGNSKSSYHIGCREHFFHPEQNEEIYYYLRLVLAANFGINKMRMCLATSVCLQVLQCQGHWHLIPPKISLRASPDSNVLAPLFLLDWAWVGLLLASLSCSHIAVWANSSSWTTSFIFSFNRCSRPALPPVPVCKSNWFPDPQQGLFAIVALLSSFSELLAHFKVLNTSRSCSPKTGIYSNVDNLCQILHINSSNAGPLQDSCRENLAAF